MKTFLLLHFFYLVPSKAIISDLFVGSYDRHLTYCVEKPSGDANLPDRFDENDSFPDGDSLIPVKIQPIIRGNGNKQESAGCLSRANKLGLGNCELVGSVKKEGGDTGAGYVYGIYDCNRGHVSMEFYQNEMKFCVEKIGGNQNFPPYFNSGDRPYNYIAGGENVKVYQNCGFTGKEVELLPGFYTLSDLQNLGVEDNDLSSIVIPAGFEVTIYDKDNFQGTSKSLRDSSQCLSEYSFNNKVTSIVIKDNFSVTPLKKTLIRSSNFGSRESTSCMTRSQKIGPGLCQLMGVVKKGGSTTGSGYKYEIYDCNRGGKSQLFQSAEGEEFCVEKLGGNNNFPPTMTKHDKTPKKGDIVLPDTTFYRKNNFEAASCLHRGSKIGLGTCNLMSVVRGSGGSTGHGYLYGVHNCPGFCPPGGDINKCFDLTEKQILDASSKYIEYHSCPSAHDNYLPYGYQIPYTKKYHKTTIDECKAMCHKFQNLDNGFGHTCEFAYLSKDNECFIYARDHVLNENGKVIKFDPPTYNPKSCNEDHSTANNGIFLVREYELITAIGDDIRVGQLGTKLIDAFKVQSRNMTKFGTQHASAGSILLESTKSYHCSTWSDLNKDLGYCQTSKSKCENQAHEATKNEKCGVFNRDVEYEWWTHHKSNQKAEQTEFWDSYFKPIVLNTLQSVYKKDFTGEGGYRSGGYYHCKFKGSCRGWGKPRSLRFESVGHSELMPEKVTIILYKHVSTPENSGTEQIARFGYMFGNEENADWPKHPPNSSSMYCSSEFGLAAGVGGLFIGMVPVVGDVASLALDVAGIGLSTACAY